MDKWRAEIHYHGSSAVALFEFEDWDDFVHWLTAGPEHDWSAVEEVRIVPILLPPVG